MSYIRGSNYVWRDDDRLHVWAEDGYDGWDDTSWAEGRNAAQARGSTTDGASGVGEARRSPTRTWSCGWRNWCANSGSAR